MGDVQTADAPIAEKTAPTAITAIGDAGAAAAEQAADSVSAEVAEMANAAQGESAASAPSEAASGEPRMGQVVEYCLNAGIYPGAWRPALVIRSVGAGCAQLAVLTDFANDGLPCPLWAPGATRGDGPGQWREQTEP